MDIYNRMHDEGIDLTDKERINYYLLDLLNSLVYPVYEQYEKPIIKDIFSELALQVNDSDYYDMGYSTDNDDIIDILYAYYINYEVDGSIFAEQLAKYCTIEEEVFHFESYNSLHQTLMSAMYCGTNQDEEEDYINTILELNEIVDSEIMVKYNQVYNALLYGNQ